MKSCHKWMILCLLGALAVIFVLPRFGLPVAGSSILIPLLMIGCCVLPMVMMMFTSPAKIGGCCSHKDDSKPSNAEVKTVAEKPSCH